MINQPAPAPAPTDPNLTQLLGHDTLLLLNHYIPGLTPQLI